MIRSSRGVALRGMCRSLIRSPLRLLMVVVLLVVPLVVAGWVLESRDDADDRSLYRIDESTLSPDRVAWGFTVAWVTHPPGTTSAEWVHRLKPYTSESFISQLQSVNPDNVPSQALTGAPRVVSLWDGRATVDVPTDGVVLRLQLERTLEGWRVFSYDAADEVR